MNFRLTRSNTLFHLLLYVKIIKRGFSRVKCKETLRLQGVDAEWEKTVVDEFFPKGTLYTKMKYNLYNSV